MAISELKLTITEQMKDSMRCKDKERLGTIRLILADIKRIEVDERIELDDNRILAVLDKMCKQRKDSIAQFQAAERPDLVEKEQQEMEVIKSFLPQPLSDADIDAMISDAITQVNATSMQDMGKVMAILKPLLLGKADIGEVSKRIKSKL